jgi:hypothetical protein
MFGQVTMLSIRKSGRLAICILLGLALLLVGLANFTTITQAYNGYSVHRLHGAYGFSSTATVLPPFVPASTPAVVVGILTFDGSGGCTVSETINVGGTSFLQIPTACSYTVSPDGSGTLSAQTPSGVTPLALVIVDSGKEILFIRTDAAIAGGVAKRQ